MTLDFTLPRFDGNPACAETDPEAFFPEPGGAGLIDAAQARKVCARCEIQPACRQWALDNAEPHGIWGGLTERQRRRITGRRRAA